MIENATLTGIRPPPAVDNAGGKTRAAATVVSVRCYCGTPRRAQVQAMANVVKHVTAMLYVPLDDVPAGIVAESRLTVQVDGLAVVAYDVEHRIDRVKAGGLSHAEIYLRGI